MRKCEKIMRNSEKVYFVEKWSKREILKIAVT